MSKTKYAIAYTIFEINGKHTRKLVDFDPVPDNIACGMEILQKRIKTLNARHKVLGLMMGAMMWGYTVRGLLAVAV